MLYSVPTNSAKQDAIGWLLAQITRAVSEKFFQTGSSSRSNRPKIRFAHSGFLLVKETTTLYYNCNDTLRTFKFKVNFLLYTPLGLMQNFNLSNIVFVQEHSSQLHISLNFLYHTEVDCLRI